MSVLVLPGDGIGKEVTAQAVKVLRAVSANNGPQFDMAEGAIGGVAERHYSFMGATAVEALLPAARDLASQLKADAVGGVLLAPV